MEVTGKGGRHGRLAGKVALITGAAQGIGHATAVLFVEEGCKVGVVDYNEVEGRKTVENINAIHGQGSAIFRKADVSQEAQVEDAVNEVTKEFGRLDILVINAATFVFGSVETATEQDWDKVLGVNVKGASWCAKHASRQMQKQEGGKGAIVVLTSISSFNAQKNFVPYSTSKAALVGFARNLALDLAPHIRVNTVAPGCIDTEATRLACATKGFAFEDLQKTEGPMHILGRIGQPREVAHGILFLASDDASFVTGTTLMVDGGWTAI